MILIGHEFKKLCRGLLSSRASTGGRMGPKRCPKPPDANAGAPGSRDRIITGPHHIQKAPMSGNLPNSAPSYAPPVQIPVMGNPFDNDQGYYTTVRFPNNETHTVRLDFQPVGDSAPVGFVNTGINVILGYDYYYDSLTGHVGYAKRVSG